MNARQPWRRGVADLQALLTGCLFAALGIVLFQHARLVPGGTVGISLALHETTGLRFSLVLVATNAAFLAAGFAAMGREFALKSVLAVLLTAGFTELLPLGLGISSVSAPFAALLGGLLCGVGMLILMRHQASLGGLNVAVLMLQERFGWPAGRSQMVMDACIVATGAWLGAGPGQLLPSLAAVAAINLVLAFNLQRPASAAR